MNLFKQFGTNKNLEKEGVFLDYGLNENGKPIRFKIARAGGSNIAFQKALEAKLRPHRRALQADMMDEALAERIMREVYAVTIVLCWEGVTDADGKELPFSKANVVKLFEMIPDFFREIQEQSHKISTYQNEELEADVKN